ncbi:MAG TPA: UPF0280 family protein [Candidatus Aminicenantes bacterium]|nr:UPF0280 family protein [Candidatus Aminicenantes bacterium]HRY66047.1 UPF0280 family protein [Candidatus Aminicenantes bacterium]HRZ72904.1 UPF0280 family protein [Candidatus Aminicenantes bacterium]
MNRPASIIRYKETVARIVADERYLPAAKREIESRYESILEYTRRRPDFIASLTPLPDDGSAPEIVRRMLEAGRRAGVGPMAAVAGAVAEFALRAMLEAGAEEALVENGGDIAMFIQRPVIIPVFAGPSSLKGLGLKIRPSGRIMGLCTSSGTVGHSLSFGKADAAVVLAGDAALADAAATSLGNAVRERDERSLEQALESSWLEGLEGMLAVAGDLLALKGNMPEVVAIAGDGAKRRDAGCRAAEGADGHE